MDTASAADLARELGTSVPRIIRGLERLGIDAKLPNGRFAIATADAERLRSELGVTPTVAGLTRPETMALAALRNAPFGLVSARAVARRSGLSPTAAARALRGLLDKDLVTQNSEVIAAGRARPVPIWRANVVSERWAELDPALAGVMPPSRPRSAPSRVPRHLRHLFWNTAESQLQLDRAAPYIARRLLGTMDLQGLAWGARALPPEAWRQAAKARGLDPGTRQLARNLAQAAEPEALRSRSPMHRSSTDWLSRDPVAGRRVASLQDLMAMKLKVMAERGEMRDYLEVRAIDEEGGVSVEEGVELFMRRYGISPSSEALPHLYKAMGDLSDVEEDDLLQADLSELQTWWSARQVKVLRNSNRFD